MSDIKIRTLRKKEGKVNGLFFFREGESNPFYIIHYNQDDDPVKYEHTNIHLKPIDEFLVELDLVKGY